MNDITLTIAQNLNCRSIQGFEKIENIDIMETERVMIISTSNRIFKCLECYGRHFEQLFQLH